MQGLGDPQARFRVYIANRPNFSPFDSADRILPLETGQIKAISNACGNGWRKVFNVYAKLLYAGQFLAVNEKYARWQDYRDGELLRGDSATSLLFSQPDLTADNVIHIVMGKHYAQSLPISNDVDWLDNEFAVSESHPLFVCPYFDYRQLSDVKIIRLVELIRKKIGNAL